MPAADEPGGGRRLFVGAKVSMATIGELSGTVEMLARRAQQAGLRVKWVAPASYHVTLKFIGWARHDAATAIGDAVARAVAESREAAPRVTDPIGAASTAAISFRAARLGAFPSTAKATVIWAGADDKGGALGRLAAAIDRELESVGVAREKRAFHGHVTLGRLRDPADVSQVILPFSEQVFSETRLTEVVLFESFTKSSGSEYSIVSRVPLFRPENEQKRQTRDVEPTPFDASDDGWDRDSERRS